MKLINKKNGKILATDIKVANNSYTRTIGLLLKSEFNTGEGLRLVPCNCIHSCFMKFKFDAVFIDKNNQIVHLIKNMSPWRFSRIVFSAHSVVELPEGVLDQTGTELGHVLGFLNN